MARTSVAELEKRLRDLLSEYTNRISLAEAVGTLYVVAYSIQESALVDDEDE